MELRQLGNTGIEVSVLGLGTVKLGRNVGVNYAPPASATSLGAAKRQLSNPQPFRLPTLREAKRLIDKARSLGVNLIDTAPAYGASEECLGKLLTGQRRDWIIVTKVGEEFDGSRSTWDFSPEHTRMSVRRSLERLRTDYLDVVLIHSDGDDDRILNELGTLECLRQLKSEGLIRAVGISHKSERGARSALERGADVLMATLNPNAVGEAKVIEEAGLRGCGVLVKKALAGGWAAPEGVRFAARHPGVSCVVVGTLSPDHLAKNASILGGPA